MKLLMCCDLGFVTKPKVWSGTTKAVYDSIKNHGTLELCPIEYGVKKNKTWLFFKNLYKRFFFFWDKDVIGCQKEWTSFLKEAFEKNNGDSLLFLSNYIPSCEQFKDKSFYIYVDCELNYEKQYLRRRHLPAMSWFMNHYNKVVRASLDGTTAVFTLNEWTRREIASQYGYDINKIFNVGVGVNCSFLEDTKDYSKKMLLIVLRKGTERYKGLDLLLEAFRIVHQEDPAVRLSVVGSDMGKNIDGVTCYYNQPREVTLQLFKEATLYVMPSLCEPNGTTYLEALANKTPIVGHDRFAFPEFCGYGKYGFIVKKHDAHELANIILNALSDFNKLRNMGEEGQKFVQARYNWDVVCSKMENVILNTCISK